MPSTVGPFAPNAAAAVLPYVVFRDVMPPFADVRRAQGDAELTKDVRMAEVMAGSLTLLGGFVISGVSRQPLPFWLSAITGGIMLGFYEYALRS